MLHIEQKSKIYTRRYLLLLLFLLRFYYEGDMRRSHTIDPRTGYPAESDLLSATVVSTSCMRADALATACMVLGSEAGLALIEQLDSTECYLIIAQPNDSMAVRTSSGFPLSESR